MNVIEKIKELKYRFDGIELVGLTGSALYKKEPNDIDIVYKIDEKFLKVCDPLRFYSYLFSIKKELENIFQKPVDLIDITTLNATARKYMKIEYV